MSKRIRLQAGARRRAKFDFDPRLTACREAAWAHRGVDGGHPGDRRSPPLCVSVERGQGMLDRSADGCCCCTIKGACQEAAHMSPATQRITMGPGRKVPGHIAIYRTLILNSRPCEATHRLPRYRGGPRRKFKCKQENRNSKTRKQNSKTLRFRETEECSPETAALLEECPAPRGEHFGDGRM